MNQPQDNSGILFRNDRKQAPNQSDYRGTAIVDGVALEVSGWIKEGRDGKKFMTLSFSRPRAAAAGTGTRPSRPSPSRIAAIEAVRSRIAF